ncbi:MAG: Ig-like domain repeat protein [Acidimicrobiales bacterium]
MKLTKPTLKAAMAGLLTAAIAGAGLAALATPAFAAGTAPPWEADGNAAPPYGNVTFYDASGNQVTSGTGDLASPFTYVVAGTAADTDATLAVVNFYNPQHGVLPASWTGTSEGSTTSFSPTPAGTPADLVAFANGSKGTTYPVAPTTADISTWLSSNTPDTTTGYANTIQVRLTDSGPGNHGNASGTYWESDIGYNNTSAPITVDGTTIPANGWAELFPFVTPTTTSLVTSATGGHLTSGGSITLTATVPTGDAGAVQFYDGTTVLGDVAVNTTTGQATYPSTGTYTPANGSHSYTASFIPGDSPGNETGANTTSATIQGGSTSSAAVVSVTPPQTGTTTTLSASATSVTYGTSVTFTSTASAADSTNPAGTVEFFDGTTAITGCTSVAINPPASATCTTTALPQGGNSVTAVFSPTSTSYASSTSAAVVVTVAAPAACSLTGSSCSDTQGVQVTIYPGTITITTPYTATNPFVLPAMQLSSDGEYLSSSAQFPPASAPYTQQIVVTSTLAPAYAWTLSVAATPLTSSGGGTIPASGLGLTGGTLLNGGTSAGDYPGTVTFTDIPALNPSPVDPPAGPGLSATPQSWAHSSAADGTAVMDGTLSLYAATSTPAGTYNGTITFTVS